jgi:hypothetical protein
MEYRLSSLLSHDNFIPVSKVLASKIGLLEATIFGELCSESDYWHERNEVTEDGYFFSTVENIEDKLFVKKDTQQRVMKNLSNSGLISIAKKGLPAKRYVKINEEILSNLLGEKTSTSERKILQLDSGKSSTNKTILNKTIGNKKEKIYKKEKFIPPTLEEVEAYCKERKNKVDAKQFYDYYTSADKEEDKWKDSKGNPVRNWKQKIIAVWEKKAEEQYKEEQRKEKKRKGSLLW